MGASFISIESLQKEPVNYWTSLKLGQHFWEGKYMNTEEEMQPEEAKNLAKFFFEKASQDAPNSEKEWPKKHINEMGFDSPKLQAHSSKS